MESKYIRKDDKKDKTKEKRKFVSYETANPYKSKYVKSKNDDETIEEGDGVPEFEESGYIKGSKRVRSYRSRMEEKERIEKSKLQQELERKRQEMLAKKEQQGDEFDTSFEAGEFIVDEAELELEQYREGPTDLATTDIDPIEYDLNEYGLSTGNESEELLAKLKKNKNGELVVGKNPSVLSGLKDNTTKSLASEEKAYEHSVIATVLAGVLLTFLATVLKFANVHLPFMPAFINLDFSALPEMIAGIAYGPIVGVGVVFLKDVLHILVNYVIDGRLSYVNEISNFILNAPFVILSSMIFNIYKGNQVKKSLLPNFKQELKAGKKKLRHRSRFVFIGGTVGSAFVSILSLFSNVYIVYPLFIKVYGYVGINEFYFLKQYLDCNENIENLFQGVLYYNVPYNFIKFYIITIIVAIIYKPLSPLLHGDFRRMKKV